MKIIKRYIDDAFGYVAESKKYVYAGIIIFAIFILLGFFVLPLNPELSGLIDKTLKEILTKTQSLSGLDLILFIFINNLTVSFFGLFLGLFLSIAPVFNLMTNGVVTGYVFAKVYSISGFSEFWRILPHGIFELPAVFISLGLGIKLGTFIFSKNIKKEFKYSFLNSLKAFFFIVIPLLIVAAIIEGLLITLFK